MKKNRYPLKTLSSILALGGFFSVPSFAQTTIWTDADFTSPKGHTWINPSNSATGADVWIQNTATAYFTSTIGSTGTLSIEDGATLRADGHVSTSNTGSGGDALLLVGNGSKATFNGGFTASVNSDFFAVVTHDGTVLNVNAASSIVTPDKIGLGLALLGNSKVNFAEQLDIKAGNVGIHHYSNSNAESKFAQVNIKMKGDGTTSLANGAAILVHPTAAGSMTYDGLVTIDIEATNTTGFLSGVVNGSSTAQPIKFNQGLQIDLTKANQGYGIYTTSSGQVNVNGSLSIDMAPASGSFALVADSGGKVNISNALVDVNGDIVASGANSQIVVQANAGSVLKADVIMQNTGMVNFDLTQTDWQLRSSSALNTLEGADSHIRFAQPNGGTPVFNTLTVNQLSGNGHVFYLNTELNDGSTQLTDKLVINNTASGDHQLHITNIGGIGEKTIQGIKVVDVQNTVTSNTAHFTLTNLVVANAYEYQLYQDTADKSWYLSSQVYDKSGPGPTSTFRPDVGVNAANSNVLIDLSVPGFGYSGGKKWMEFQRTPEKSNDFWMHTNGSKVKGHAASQVGYDADLWGLSLGGDRRFETRQGVVHIGAMANIGGADTKAHSRITGSKATGNVEGYAVGIYGTWYLSDEESKPVPYIDGLLSYGHYKNEVATKGNSNSRYNANVITTSVQVGYPIQVTNSVAIEPQAQMTYLHASADDYVDHTGTKVSTEIKGHLISRIGAYVYRTQGDIRPYVGVSVWHDPTFTQVGYTDNSGRTNVSSGKRGTIMDARVGVRAQLNRHWDIWAEGGYRKGANSYQNAGVSVGLNYSF